ncbi:hypothetical protein [Pseudarthrobacter sp. NamB4]|nr:hypothetical protein [Pseudarthrobacter sp. NamB4]
MDDTPNCWRGRIDVPEFSKDLLGPHAVIGLNVTPRRLALDN